MKIVTPSIIGWVLIAPVSKIPAQTFTFIVNELNYPSSNIITPVFSITSDYTASEGTAVNLEVSLGACNNNLSFGLYEYCVIFQ